MILVLTHVAVAGLADAVQAQQQRIAFVLLDFDRRQETVGQRFRRITGGDEGARFQLGLSLPRRLCRFGGPRRSTGTGQNQWDHGPNRCC